MPGDLIPTVKKTNGDAPVYVCNFVWSGTGGIVDLSNEESYRETPCSVQANMVINNLLYHFDKNSFALKRVNIEDGTTTHVFKLDRARLEGYTVAHILDVSITGILLGAYRLSDKHYLLARMNTDNEITILQDMPGEVSLFTSLD
ncbi:MAG: hypothetical protein PHD28_08225 [Proteiniphilum sp.]|nr:hypothetical protein [Proteiniphilum sp.]